MYPSLKVMPDDGSIYVKLSKIKACFQEIYGCAPEFYARAPGRVNLIGEHIDYCGYSVFPMAIQQDIIIGVANRSDDQICIANIDDKYEKLQCDIHFKIDEMKPKWHKYLLCGIQGIRDNIKEDIVLPGLSFLVFGNIPPSAGLSSSSALVCASALALAHCLKAEFTSKTLAEICARSERYIGTQGGGMDQAASFLSTAGSAQLIEFEPLRCTPVSLPEGSTFVVVNSLTEKNKATSSEFNTRVIECRLACRILAQKCNIKCEGKFVLGDLQKRLGRSFSEMVELVKEFLHPQPYSKQEICQLLKLSNDQLDQDILSENTRHITEYNLYKRALHVFTEASRVLEFKGICEQYAYDKGSAQNNKKVLQQLGMLMDESHSSARILYECSHPNLDKLLQISKDEVYGARLTGAGWGGCIVALVDAEKCAKYIEIIKKEYFKKVKTEDWSSIVFSTAPGDGACIYTQ